MTYDLAARERHFLDHLTPVWNSLPKELQGQVWVDPSILRYARRLGLQASASESVPFGGNPTLCASWGDARRTRKAGRPVVMLEHGAGQSYIGSDLPSYVGAPDRDRVFLVLVPNEQAAQKHVAVHPDIPVEVIGCPKLDTLIQTPAPTGNRVALSHHWDGAKVAPECRSTFPHYKRVYPSLCKTFDMIGHAHPKVWKELNPMMSRMGFDMMLDFQHVVEAASVYVMDNSSTLFEFAALNRPVVVLNAPWYRRDVHHGGRFWDWADVGVQVDDPSDLIPAVRSQLDNPNQFQLNRERIVGEIYPFLGVASVQAASVLVEHHDRLMRVAPVDNKSMFSQVPHPSRRTRSRPFSR